MSIPPASGSGPSLSLSLPAGLGWSLAMLPSLLLGLRSTPSPTRAGWATPCPLSQIMAVFYLSMGPGQALSHMGLLWGRSAPYPLLHSKKVAAMPAWVPDQEYRLIPPTDRHSTPNPACQAKGLSATHLNHHKYCNPPSIKLYKKSSPSKHISTAAVLLHRTQK